jgi:hypothetical protein
MLPSCNDVAMQCFITNWRARKAQPSLQYFSSIEQRFERQNSRLQTQIENFGLKTPQRHIGAVGWPLTRLAEMLFEESYDQAQ